jgi:hypothetical protein
MNIEPIAKHDEPLNFKVTKNHKFDILTVLFISVWGLSAGAFAQEVLNPNGMLPICAVATLLTINWFLLPCPNKTGANETKKMKIYRIAFSILGVTSGLIIKLSLNTQISLIALNIISCYILQYFSTRKEGSNIIASPKEIILGIQEKSINFFNSLTVKVKSLFDIRTLADEIETCKKKRALTVQHLETLKVINRNNLDQMEKFKHFLQNDPELMSSFTHAVEETDGIFTLPFRILEPLNDELFEELRQETRHHHFFNILKRDLKDLLENNPAFQKLLELKLMQHHQKNTIDWIHSETALK